MLWEAGSLLSIWAAHWLTAAPLPLCLGDGLSTLFASLLLLPPWAGPGLAAEMLELVPVMLLLLPVLLPVLLPLLGVLLRRGVPNFASEADWAYVTRLASCRCVSSSTCVLKVMYSAAHDSRLGNCSTAWSRCSCQGRLFCSNCSRAQNTVVRTSAAVSQ
jgi:hypothetical protein